MKSKLLISLFGTIYSYNSYTELENALKNRDQITFVNFGDGDWCTKCKELEPVWDQLRAKAEELFSSTKILSVNCGDDHRLCREFTTFPVVKAFKGSNEISKYADISPRTMTAIESWQNEVTKEHEMILVESGGVMFYPETGYFYENLDLTEDFPVSLLPGYVDSGPEGDERYCRNRCVDEKKCHAYSVKVEEPMRGQCYLKKQLPIGKEIYSGTANIKYNSGRIAAQQFPHCQSNVYGHRSVYESNKNPDETGCWSQRGEADSEGYKDCDITNPKCISVICTDRSMKGSVRKDAFHDDHLLDENEDILRNILFNRNFDQDCHDKVVYDPETRNFNFEFELGTCGMLTSTEKFPKKNGETFIKFQVEMSFEDPPTNEFGIFLASFYTASVGFQCSYKATTEADHDFKVITRIFNGQAAQYVNWDYSAQLDFFETSEFKNQIEPSSLNIGYPVYFTATWDVQFVEGFPVQFYMEKCTVESMSSGAKYDIIKDGCGSFLADTKLYSQNGESIYATNKLRFGYRSFSFSQGQSKYDMTLKCDVNFCLKKDINGVCGVDPTKCPPGYGSLA